MSSRTGSVRRERERVGKVIADTGIRDCSRASGAAHRQWKQLDNYKEQKIGLRPVATSYINAVFLENCRTALRGGNGISRRFNIDPPSLSDYLDGFDALKLAQSFEDSVSAL